MVPHLTRFTRPQRTGSDPAANVDFTPYDTDNDKIIDFVRKVLADKLHVKAVYCGNDLSFGYKGRGNVDTLKALSEELGIEVHVIEKEKYHDEDISSTRIREAIKEGNEEDARIMLADER